MSPPQTFLLGLQCPARPLTQGEGQEQWQGAGAAAGNRAVHQPRAARPRSPWTSLSPPPAPLSQASGVRGGAWKLIPEPAGNETTPQAGTLATGQANTQGGGRRAPVVSLGGESLLFILAHTHQRGAGLRGGSVQVVPTQINPHPRPHSSSYWGCLWASSATPPAGSHLTLPVPLPWGVNQ